MKKRKKTFDKKEYSIITNQRNLGDVKYGLLGSAKDNACGAVAIHNIKKLLEIRSDFTKDYESISKRGTTLGLGVFGTNPLHIDKLIKKMDVRFEKTSFLKTDQMRDIFNKARYVVLLYRWKSIFDLHYAVFEIKDNSILGYNTVRNRYIDVKDMLDKEHIKAVYRAWWML